MKEKLLTIFLMVGFVLGGVGLAQAIQIDATITADNYYALYSGDETEVTFVGRNALRVSGTTRAYNWSVPENYNFDVTAGDYIYIAAWSDASVTQAWLGQFDFSGQSLLSNAQNWEVYLTYEEPNYANGLIAPTTDSVRDNVVEANATGWAGIFDIRNNGDSPWGPIAGISAEANINFSGLKLLQYPSPPRCSCSVVELSDLHGMDVNAKKRKFFRH